ncbi:MAG: ABC transporter ATP-binding protein [Desulfobacterales bacterium]|nr:ABC transporter ATP-binding protein [Desulfobacterales bacterium]
MFKATNLHKSYFVDGNPVRALRGVSFTINKGDVYTLLGPSGCGKTTMLRCIAGLETPDQGEITLQDKVLFSSRTGESEATYRRNLGMVFQSYAIWPHMNVFDNVAFPLYYGGRKHSKQEIKDFVKKALQSVELEGFESRSATLLSGGQQQRVALARALVYQPSIFLLDEPLSNLDARLRDEVRQELKELVKRLNLTVLYVTHDQVEALSLSDRIAVMRDGLIVQEGTPSEIYLTPQETFVGTFVGKANLIQGVLVEKDGAMCRVKTDLGLLQGATSGVPVQKGDSVVVLIRPNIITAVTQKPAAETNVLEAELVDSTFTGALTECQTMCGNVAIEAQIAGLIQFKVKEKIYLQFPPELCRILPAKA